MSLYEEAEKKIKENREQLELESVAIELAFENRQLKIYEKLIADKRKNLRKLKDNDYKFRERAWQAKDKNGNHPLYIEYNE